jgi:Cof subfamily protein (haloacid dehalogenase superfamily)
MSRYNAIFFDLDGTAIQNRGDAMPSPRLIEAIAGAKDKIHFIPTTGRTLTDGLPVIAALGTTGPAIMAGGTIIIDPVSGKIIKRTTLTAAAVRAVMDIAADYPEKPLYIREERLGPNPRSTHSHLIDDTEMMMLSGIDDEEIAEIGERLSSIPHVAASVARSWYGGHIFNITHEDATKEHAVTEVLQILGVPKQASIGIGDGGNDLHLFRAVGYKIAMANAYPELKAAADEIAPSIDEDGLAQMIEKYAG